MNNLMPACMIRICITTTSRTILVMTGHGPEQQHSQHTAQQKPLQRRIIVQAVATAAYSALTSPLPVAAFSYHWQLRRIYSQAFPSRGGFKSA